MNLNEKNIFCNKENLRNESDVEQFFIKRLLEELGFKDANIFTKLTLPYHLRQTRGRFFVWQDPIGITSYQWGNLYAKGSQNKK